MASASAHDYKVGPLELLPLVARDGERRIVAGVT